jgi:sortase A
MERHKIVDVFMSLLIVGGIGYAGFHGYQWVSQLSIGAHDAKAVQKEIQKKPVTKHEKPDDGTVIYPDSLRPAKGKEFGKLIIPRLNVVLPIFEGADEEELAKGVAHAQSTVLPGEPDVSLLSGHRDTVFRHVGDLKPGDKLMVETEMGRFTYTIEKSWVVDANEKVHSLKKPYLLLSTCYPFSYIGPAPQRYLILAKFENPNN